MHITERAFSHVEALEKKAFASRSLCSRKDRGDIGDIIVGLVLSPV